MPTSLSLRPLGLLLPALALVTVSASSDLRACVGPQYGYYLPSYPEPDSDGVPVNVQPLFHADVPAAVGLFDETGSSVAIELDLVSVSPRGVVDSDGSVFFEYTNQDSNVYQVRPLETLAPQQRYELWVVMAEIELAEVVLLDEHPAQTVVDGGAPDAGTSLAWPAELERDEFEPTIHRLTFSTGTSSDDVAPSPPSVWMSHGLFEKDRETECLGAERICFGNVAPGARVLASLVLGRDGSTIEHMVLLERDTMYMPSRFVSDEIVSATLVNIDHAGNLSEPVTLDRRDIPHNVIPSEYDDEQLRFCDEQRDEGIWRATEGAEPDAAAPSSTADAGNPTADQLEAGADAAPPGTAPPSASDDSGVVSGDDEADGDDDGSNTSNDSGPRVEPADPNRGSCACRVGRAASETPLWFAVLIPALAFVRRRAIPSISKAWPPS